MLEIFYLPVPCDCFVCEAVSLNPLWPLSSIVGEC
jgi:hypothetical protein